MRLAISWCYFEAQVWKKDSSISPLFLGLLFFFGLSLFLLGQCSIEWWSSHFYLFTTQWLQLDTRTKYDSIWMPLAVYRDMQWTKSDMYERIMNGSFATNTMSTTWSCKAIWQWWTCHDKRNGGKLHGNISRNGYGNAIIGRYGGCFEEDIISLCVIERIISWGLDAPAKFAPRLNVRKGNARYYRG